MKTALKKISLLFAKCLLAGLLYLGIYHFCRYATGGFRMDRILSKLSYNFEWDIAPLSVEEEKAIQSMLSQTYSYLGKGGQCFAFVSEDQTTVLKLFKHHYMRSMPWLENYKLPWFLDKSMKRQKKNLENTFKSFKVAYEHLKEETGVIYLHLNKTKHLQKTITLIDKIGIKHAVDADDLEFALQKKAEMAYPKLQRLINEKDIETAKICIDAFLEFLTTRANRGIEDVDHTPQRNIQRNIGFIGNKCVEVDLGTLYYNLERDKDFFKNEIIKETGPLKKWMAERHPHLSSYLDDRVQTLLDYRE